MFFKHVFVKYQHKCFCKLFFDEILRLFLMKLAVISLLRIEKDDPVDIDLLKYVRENLEKRFYLHCEIADSVVEVPVFAYNPQREQYEGEILLKIIRSYSRQKKRITLGVTKVDLYIDALNFIFGLAQCPGTSAVISLCRLYPSFYSLTQNEDLLRKRTLTEAVHELGHCMGLKHCKLRRCVMAFSNSIEDTDYKQPIFCDSCRKKLDKIMEK